MIFKKIIIFKVLFIIIKNIFDINYTHCFDPKHQTNFKIDLYLIKCSFASLEHFFAHKFECLYDKIRVTTCSFGLKWECFTFSDLKGQFCMGNIQTQNIFRQVSQRFQVATKKFGDSWIKIERKNREMGVRR